MWFRRDWLAARMLLTATIGLSVTFVACTPSGPNSSEKALVGGWTHTADPPSSDESQFSFNGDRTFTVLNKRTNEKDAEVESTAKGTWRATDKSLCLKFMSCTGPDCPSAKDLPAKDPLCTPFRLAGSTLTIIGSGGPTEYTAGTPSSGPNASEKALVGHWVPEKKDDTSGEAFEFSGDRTFTLFRHAEKDGAEVESTAKGTWRATPGSLCLKFMSCTGCESSRKLPETICNQFTLAGSTLKIDDIEFIRQ
jgi:hypothetical protein